ncbi:T9SS type A sorting domain-containing protein [Pontibacter chitinilyticus]|uniref:T9SS type A sorting domain-containing protein n=1 Tax=Pontibacter chitinilyticus TaxID=2674989 RepID=UPI00321946ED
MKNLYIAFLLLVLSANQAFAQTFSQAYDRVILYHENFSGTVSGITSNSTWEINTIAPLSNSAQASGGAFAHTIPYNTTNPKILYLDNAISTVGFKNIGIIWTNFRTKIKNNVNNNATITLYYSIDNGPYTAVAYFPQSENVYNQWNLVNNGSFIQLPAAVANKANVRFYWSVNTPSKFGDDYALDDITLVGTPDDDQSTPEDDLSTFDWSTRAVNENPFVTSSSTAATPYTVNGISLRWTLTAGAGVSVSKAAVDDATFQAPVKTLSLTQSGASATVGTTVQLDFSDFVKDLTFTLFDVDQASGQFQDHVVITGVTYSGGVVMPKNKIQYTSKHSYNATSGVITGISGTDVAAASDEGNIKVSFGVPVSRVKITYYNDDAAKGNQGIAIHNLYWRRNRSVITLPVELVYFKGQVASSTGKFQWVTASEKNNDRFEVERSEDGRNFLKIGEVKGHGNSSSAINYSFIDTNPAPGTNYYRLRQVDTDGTTSFSTVVALAFSSASSQTLSKTSQASVYPTFATTEVTVRVSEAARIQVLDATGKPITSLTSPASGELILPVQHLQRGVYFVTIYTGQQRETLRFVKQ